MTGLHPRLRELCTAAEWALIEQGLCPYGGPRDRCRGPADPESRFGYCAGHDVASRVEFGDAYFADGRSSQ